MGLRKEVPHAKCSPLCAIKEKLQELWDRAYGCINKINDITPDGDGKFSIQAGTNIQLTEISNGLKIDTTGGITYYSAADTYIDVNNNDLEISLVNPGQTGGVALHDDLEVVAQAVVDVVNGTTQVGDAAHADAADSATYLGSDTSNVGSDTKPVKIVNGQAVAVTNDLAVVNQNNTFTGSNTFGNFMLTGSWQNYNTVGLADALTFSNTIADAANKDGFVDTTTANIPSSLSQGYISTKLMSANRVVKTIIGFDTSNVAAIWINRYAYGAWSGWKKITGTAD